MSAEEDASLSDSTTAPSLHDLPGRTEWEVLYPTMHDMMFADINKCPPNLVIFVFVLIIYCLY